MRTKNIWVIMIAVVLISLFAVLGSQSITKVERNLQVKGWLFGNASDKTWAGQTTWVTTGTADTLLVSGVDTTCVVFLAPKTATGTLRYDIATAGDTIFVTSSGSETGGTDKYAWIVIRNAYGATD